MGSIDLRNRQGLSSEAIESLLRDQLEPLAVRRAGDEPLIPDNAVIVERSKWIGVAAHLHDPGETGVCRVRTTVVIPSRSRRLAFMGSFVLIPLWIPFALILQLRAGGLLRNVTQTIADRWG